MWRLSFTSTLVLVAFATPPGHADPRLELDVEGAVVWSGRNDVRIPGDRGTLFSLSEDLATESDLAGRVRGWWRLGERHSIGALYAPLELRASGAAKRDILFESEQFSAGEELSARFRFDSYRLTYRYDLRRGTRLDLAIGLTAKIRDAEIRVESPVRRATKTNTGFVPLLYVRARWELSRSLAVLLEADALAAPQGRAEDVLLALEHRVSDRLDLRAGYRLVEGGADNDEVYTFAWIHYATVGAALRF